MAEWKETGPGRACHIGVAFRQLKKFDEKMQRLA